MCHSALLLCTEGFGDCRGLEQAEDRMAMQSMFGGYQRLLLAVYWVRVQEITQLEMLPQRNLRQTNRDSRIWRIRDLITPTRVQFRSGPVKYETPLSKTSLSIWLADAALIACANSVAEIRRRSLG